MYTFSVFHREKTCPLAMKNDECYKNTIDELKQSYYEFLKNIKLSSKLYSWGVNYKELFLFYYLEMSGFYWTMNSRTFKIKDK